MSVSDLSVGKAGPNFVYESIFMEVPILATGCLPGQEDGNLDFILREDLGWVEKNLKKSIGLVEQIVKDRNLLKGKNKNVKKIKLLNANSGKNFVDELVKLVV